jgi:hypothetical protein
MKIIITLCEGPHDVEFLYKILRTTGYRTYGKKVEELPVFLKEHVLSAFRKFPYEEKNLYERPVLPTLGYHEAKDILMMFYALGGDGKIDEANFVIRAFQDLIITKIHGQIDMGLAFIYDADDDGVASRVNNIKTNFRRLLPEIENIDHNKVISGNEYQAIGAYIFSNGDGIGKLEDILLPLMKEDNEPIFDDAQKYLNDHFDDTRFKNPRDMRKYYDHKKSLIGMAGQLQRSGRNNTMIIKDSDYITTEKIEGHATCMEILAFFDNVYNNI